MPTYDYKCVTCKKEFDVFYRSIREAVETEAEELCPHCGSRIKERQVSKETGHILKGKGWYRDGYSK